MAKSPLELIIPFNKYSISQKKGETPSSFFGGAKRMVNMSPNDYFKFVSHMSGTTPEKLMKQRQEVTNEISVDDIRKKMREGTKFDTPWLRLDDYGEPGSVNPYWQEGLHRMLAAGQEYGMDTKFPIYIGYENDRWEQLDNMPMDDFIKYYDDTRLKRYNARKEQERLKQEEEDNWWKEQTADHFNVLLIAVTPDMIKEYQNYTEKLFEEDFN